MEPSKDINQISNRELLKDFLHALTDIEKRLFQTMTDLFIRPEAVVFGYIGKNRDQYLSVFRYLILVVFLGYISYSLFMKPQEIGGPFYISLRKGIEAGLQARDTLGRTFTFSAKAFDAFYLEYTKMMAYFFKFTACFSIPAICLAFVVFLRGLKFNVASLLVASVFLSSQASLLSHICLIPLSVLVSDVWIQTYILYSPVLIYLTFAFYRLGKGQVSKALVRSFGAALFAILIFYSLNMAYGIGLYSYVRTYTPKFAIKKELSTGAKVEKTIHDENH